MSTTDHKITVAARVAESTVEQVVDNALYAGWGWWGGGARVADGWALSELDDDGNTVARYTVRSTDIARAIARVLNGDVPLRRDLAKQVESAVGPDPDIDADASDCLLQIAAFGEVRYG